MGACEALTPLSSTGMLLADLQLIGNIQPRHTGRSETADVPLARCLHLRCPHVVQAVREAAASDHDRMAAVADRITNGQVTLGGESAGVTMEPSSTVDAAAGGRRSSRCLVQAMPVTTSGFRRAGAHRPGRDKRHVARRGGDDLWGGGGGSAHRGHPDVSAVCVSLWCARRTPTVWPGLSRRGAVGPFDVRGNIRTSGSRNSMADRRQHARHSQLATERRERM
jgi:hypothetical protein